MHRRSFLATSAHAWAALTGLSSFLRGESASARPLLRAPGAVDPRDENFWSLVRDHFPLTRERAYLNTGGLGASPHGVIHALKRQIDELEYICETGHSEELWHSVKEKAALVLGCDPGEIAYTRNTTEGVSIVCNGLPFKSGDEIITTTHEHVGNTLAWLARQQRDGLVIKAFEPDLQSASETLDRLERLITPRTRCLSLSHVTCSAGQIMPVDQIGELAARHGLWYFVDGAQAPGMLPVDVRAMGCHAYATSGHKWLLGPKGTGLLYVRRDALDLIQARFVGGYSNQGPFDLRTGQFSFHSTARRYEYGTVSAPLFAGLGAALQFLLDVGIDNIWRRDHALAAALKGGLNELGAEVLSPQDPSGHSAMITFKVKGIDYPRLQSFLAQNFQLRTRGVYEGELNALRVSLHLYNSFAEVERVLEGVQAAQQL
jgi:selenocysteine lyase/cysteine desulfurase